MKLEMSILKNEPINYENNIQKLRILQNFINHYRKVGVYLLLGLFMII